MTRELTAYEVLEIAEAMERSAAKFYRKAAGMYQDPRISKLFSDLAQWEKRHIEVFAEMKQRLSGQSWEMGQYGQERGIASKPQPPAAVLADYASPSQELTGQETKAEVLRIALGKESDSIAYYKSVQGHVSRVEDVEAVRDIIEEEERHVRILTQSLEQTTSMDVS